MIESHDFGIAVAGGGRQGHNHEVPRGWQLPMTAERAEALAQRQRRNALTFEPAYRSQKSVVPALDGSRPGQLLRGSTAALPEERNEQRQRCKGTQQGYQALAHRQAFPAAGAATESKVASTLRPFVTAAVRLAGETGIAENRSRSHTPASSANCMRESSSRRARRHNSTTVSALAAGRRGSAVSRAAMSSRSSPGRARASAASISARLTKPGCANKGALPRIR